MENIEFGKRLDSLMKLNKISNQYLTEKAGISKNNIGNYKNGQIPNAKILYNISQILGTTMEYLLTGKEAEALNTEEKKLIENYRKADDRGKRRIQSTADQEAQEQKSSNYKIG